MIKPELLAPAGSLEKLKVALLYGADAVYFGGHEFSLRAYSNNFTPNEMVQGVELAHSLGKKAYVTINIFPHNKDIEALPDYLRYIQKIGADSIIVSDLGVWRIAKQTVPELPIHISTQANNTNWSSVLAWQEMGAKRVVLARELSLTEIQEIRNKVEVELEAFVHGAMCISYSGRCLLSNYFTGRDANRGQCTQPCRWKYGIVEEKRPGQYFNVEEDERGTYIFNSKDLCLLSSIPHLIDAGLNSFKIEGRMKSVHYVATVVKVYRQVIDLWFQDPAKYMVQEIWRDELEKISHRAYTTGFYYNKTTSNDQIYSGSTNEQTHDFIGLVKSYDAKTGTAVVEQRNNMKVGETIEIFQPTQATFTQTIVSMVDQDGVSIDVAPHPQQIITIPVSKPVEPFSMLRRKVK